MSLTDFLDKLRVHAPLASWTIHRDGRLDTLFHGYRLDPIEYLLYITGNELTTTPHAAKRLGLSPRDHHRLLYASDNQPDFGARVIARTRLGRWLERLRISGLRQDLLDITEPYDTRPTP